MFLLFNNWRISGKSPFSSPTAIAVQLHFITTNENQETMIESAYEPTDFDSIELGARFSFP